MSKKTSLAARVAAAAATALLTARPRRLRGSSGSARRRGWRGPRGADAGLRAGRRRERLAHRQHEVDPGLRRSGGVDLKFSDAQQKQENQIKAIRSYIQQKVDVIAFSPVVTTGWDTVLQEAKRANIPVILTDRAVDTPDKTLYKTFLGSDFVAEGKKAGDWLVEQEKAATGPVAIVAARGHHRLGPGHRPHQGLRRRHRGQPEPQGRRARRPATSPAPAASR